MSDYIEIPPDQLAPELLDAVIEAFINREGTDYGLLEYSLDQKVKQIKSQLESGRVVIAYDTATESCTVLVKE
ncbi:MAG: YheU family protein [Pseudomonadales bacterium]